MLASKLIELINFAVGKVGEGLPLILACFNSVSVQYYPQERTDGSKGCPRVQGQKMLLVPAEIRTNISVSAYDLPKPKVFYSFPFKLFLGLILVRLNNDKTGTCAS